MAEKRKIVIKKANRGLLRKETKTAKGKKIPVATLKRLKRDGTPAERKRATFALNARKWKKPKKGKK